MRRQMVNTVASAGDRRAKRHGQNHPGPATVAAGPAMASRYTRLFRADDEPSGDIAGLIELGQALATDRTATRDYDDGSIPAGYTYLGQLVAHELTFQVPEGPPQRHHGLTDIGNGRRPLIDFQGIYGGGPDSSDRPLYRSDGVRMRLGPVPVAGGVRWLDLPRRPDGTAIVADPRNDQNLAVAQTLVAVLRFHNRVADFLDRANPTRRASFGEVRACVVQHLQSIVLHDLAWRLVPDAIHDDVMAYGRRIFHPGGLHPGGVAGVPIEFAQAAFRCGHSMARTSYRWNRHHENATLRQLFDTTGRNGGAGFRGLTADWIIDWSGFYDLAGIAGAARRKEINLSRKLDSRMAALLGGLPAGECRHGEPAHLAVRDLLRGHASRLASGQQAARQCLADSGVYVGCLTPNELARLRNRSVVEVMQRRGYDRRTPLSLYVLAEAELEQGGDRLGRLGGRIVMEVLHGLVASTPESILAWPGWRPLLPAARPDLFTMPDLLAVVGDVGGD